MWKRKATVATLAIGAVALAGACADSPLTGPLDGAVGSEPVASLFRTGQSEPLRDARLAQIAQQVPGFGGYYLDEHGVPHVVMARAADPLTAQALSTLASHLSAVGVDLSPQPISVLAGEYDFAQLHAWHQAILPVLSLPGVVYTDADERANRVTIAVEDAGAARAAEQAARMAGVPAAALNIRVSEPIAPMPLVNSAAPMSNHTLHDMQRPVAGGLQIHFGGFLCTHGFGIRPAVSPTGPDYWVTSGFCSDGVGTSYWQPASNVPNSLIGGTIYRDGPPPPAFGWLAGQNYEPGVPNAFGQIYRTTDILSLTIDPVNPRWQIVEELSFPPVGTVVHKTGRGTGWTQGVVDQSCVNVPIAGVILFCQDIIIGPAPIFSGGDTGAAAFVRIGTSNDVRHSGIVWGGGGGGTIWVQSSNDMLRTGYGCGYIVCPTCLEVTAGPCIFGLPPQVRITRPPADTPVNHPDFMYDGFDRTRGMWYTDVALEGEAFDPEDGWLTGASLRWTTDRTDLQGAMLGTGTELTARLYSNECFGLWHQITLTATDSHGNSASAVRRIFIWTLC